MSTTGYADEAWRAHRPALARVLRAPDWDVVANADQGDRCRRLFSAAPLGESLTACARVGVQIAAGIPTPCDGVVEGPDEGRRGHRAVRGL